MIESTMSNDLYDDPRKLSAMIARAASLAGEHKVSSALVGMAAEEGDPAFPDYIAYLQSALRVEDGIFRMTRERAVVHLADVDLDQAVLVLERLSAEFADQFPAQDPPQFYMRIYEANPGKDEELKVRDVLTEIFKPPTLH
ncbi:MAG: hypothetical protein CL917_10270 [Deltaproteobacteria bacterium]|nr:hypothetical protein [Deltaproteobacteria bacterium]